MTTHRLPIISSDIGLAQYMQQIQQFPMLEVQEERSLAKRLIEHDDVKSAHKLVTSHLRLVAKIAMGYRGYGLPVMDLIAEGNIGLMQAVKKFDPERGFRLSTYAMWWIKASIQEYVLRSWSLVKIGTTTAQKKLFFNLRKLKERLKRVDNNSLSPAEVSTIAQELNVAESDVTSMDMRLSHMDSSLNQPLLVSQDESESVDQIDMLPAQDVAQDVLVSEHQEQTQQKALLHQALETLNTREKDIFVRRQLHESVDTLEVLSQEYQVSRERIRQIENRAMEKIRKHIAASVTN